MFFAFLVDVMFYKDDLKALNWTEITAFIMICIPNVILLFLRMLNLIS